MQRTLPGLKRLLYLLTIVRLVLPFLLQHPSYQPHRDEFLYLDYGHHLDWGYMEVPPLLSLFSWMVQHLGNTIFWVKFFPALVGSLTFLLCGNLVLHLGGNRLSLWLMFMGFTFSAYLRLFHLFQPGFLEVFSWTLIGYTLIRYQQTSDHRWLWAFGMACGMGMMSKYTTAFYLAGLAGGLMLTPKRKLFTQKHFWIGAMIATVICLPNFYWQYKHRFPLITHMQELRETQLVHLGASAFITDQFFMSLPVVFLWITALLFVAFTEKGKPYRWMAWQYLLVLLLLILGSGKGYYALGLYPLLLAIGAYKVGPWLMERRPGVRLAWMAIPFLLGIISIGASLPIFKPPAQVKFFNLVTGSDEPQHTWEDLKKHPLPQDFSDMLGWQEIAAMTARHYHALPDSIKRQTMIYCRGYFTAGALNFYRHQFHLPITQSDNGSYLLWMPEQYPFKHLMMIGHRMPDPDDEVFNHFGSKRILDSLSLPLARENGIKLFFFEHADSLMSSLVEKGIAEEKARFTR